MTVANILCVDDEPSIIALRKEILEGAGYTVKTCLAVVDALYELREADFDAVVTDWRFDEGSGRAIVKAAKLKPGLPVVVVSGYVGEAFQSADPMADIYLEKPADTVELLQVLKILLEVRTKKISWSA